MKTVCLALLLLFFPSHLALTESGELPQVQTYDELVRALRDVRQSTRPESKHEKVREAWKNFMLEAEVSSGNIPREVMNDPALLEKLPAFFRTVRGSELGRRKVDKKLSVGIIVSKYTNFSE